MAQPDFVPVSDTDRVRPAERLPAPEPWEATRPADLPGLRPPSGHSMGNTGPDQGYGLKLARRFGDRLELQAGEHGEDAVAGALAVGLKRAAQFGRAPVIYDFELAYSVFGFLGGAPDDLVEHRRRLFAGADHDYWTQRRIADLVPAETLRLTPAQVRAQLSSWRALLALETPASTG
ncbi:MAG: hypothetical protein KY439_08400 [Actinobacteria bacterium]|nr:hypothetical protein [Actinomycetota bacterium]